MNQGEAVTTNQADSASVKPLLTELAEAARSVFGAEFVSIVLFGSAAEDRLRASTDVNLAILLERVGESALGAFREPLRAAHANTGRRRSWLASFFDRVRRLRT